MPETFCCPIQSPSGAMANALAKPGGDWNSLVVLTMPCGMSGFCGAAAAFLAAAFMVWAWAAVAAAAARVPVTNARLLSMVISPGGALVLALCFLARDAGPKNRD